jgi:hypothetical protein
MVDDTDNTFPSNPEAVSEKWFLKLANENGVDGAVQEIAKQLEKTYGPTDPVSRYMTILLGLLIRQLELATASNGKRVLLRGRSVWILAEAWRQLHGVKPPSPEESAEVPAAKCSECGGKCKISYLTSAVVVLKCSNSNCGHTFRHAIVKDP